MLTLFTTPVVYLYMDRLSIWWNRAHKGSGRRAAFGLNSVQAALRIALEGRTSQNIVLTITETDQVFVLTGAGISAESGIATFRGSGGLWRDYRFEDVASPQAWRRDPQLVWEFYSMRRLAAARAKPNAAHLALAQWGNKPGHRLFLCTQNVDNLHEQAGSRGVIHMHGELFKSRCDSCDRPPFEDANVYEPPAKLPECNCGGRIRPHICWFGEVPFGLDLIFRELDLCTLFIAIGTSGVVEPAASFAAHVHGRARTIYVGLEEPSNNLLFAEYHAGKAGDVLPKLFGTDRDQTHNSRKCR